MSDNIEKPEGSDETVVVSKQELSSIMERIAKLETGNTMVRAERPKYHTSKVWFIDEEKTEVVIGYGKNRNDRQVDGTEILMVEILYRDKKDEVKTIWKPLIEYRNGDHFIVGKVKEVKHNPKTTTIGRTTLKNVDYEKYRTTDSDIEVPLEVVTPDDTYVMELPDGRVIELPENALN